MRQCPVCEKDTSENLCPVCGFDFSRDYEHAPTFAPTMSIAARRKAWQERLEAREQIAALENELNQVRQELDSFSGHAPRKRRNLLLRCWDKYLSCLRWLRTISLRYKTIVESSRGFSKLSNGISGAVVLFTLYFLFLYLSVLLFYGVMTIGHSALFHAPWSSAPCVVRDSCFYFVCAPEDHHEWSDSVCLEPRTCTVCGASHGGTDSHVWEIADVGGTEQCILCDTERGAPSFAYVTTADESIHSGYFEGDTLTNVLEFDDISRCPKDGVSAEDFRGHLMPILHSTQGNSLTLTFPSALSDGAYSVYDERGELATLYCCRPGTPFPCGQVTIEGRFRAENLLTGQYLERTDAGYCTTAKRSHSQFSKWSPGEPYQYQYITRDGEWLTLYVFEDNGRCLAANSNGTVYWSNELTDECYWLIQEEAN